MPGLTLRTLLSPRSGSLPALTALLDAANAKLAGGQGKAAKPEELKAVQDELAAAQSENGQLRQSLQQFQSRVGQAQDFARYHLGKRIAQQLMTSTSPQPAVAAYGKLALGVFAADRGRAAMEIAGADALVWPTTSEMPMSAKGFLNARMTCIAAGTNEMQRNAIGERVLGLPREPSFDLTKPFGEVVRDAHTWDGRVC